KKHLAARTYIPSQVIAKSSMQDIQLDQLWYTWSRYGLGSMPMGFRVRAASEGLYDIQSLRYHSLDRFLGYVLPEGVSTASFEPREAPITLAFLNNGQE